MKRSVVIFDGDKSFLYVMGVIFKRQQFNVIASSRIDEIISGLKDTSVKVIFLSADVKFRNKDGIDICKSLNKAYQGRIPIIITSTEATEEKVIRCVQAGALEFLLKPPNEKKVMDKVHYAMSLGNSKFIVADNLKNLNFKEGMTLPEMVHMVIEEADEIRGMPQAVAKIIEVSNDEKTGAAAMEKAIQSDAAIAAMVLKLANSAYYKGQSPIKEISKAVVRIGFDECRKLVLSLSVFKLFSSEQKNFGFNRGHYWLHSITTAVIAEALARKAGSSEDADAFMVGLLHDFGKIVLDDYLSEHFQKALHICSINDLCVFEAESNIFERDHAGITKAIMTKWNFPEHLGEAVLRHHHPPQQKKEATDSVPELGEIIFVANQLAKATLLGGAGDSLATPIPTHVWESYKVKNGQFDIEEIKNYYKKVKDFLGFLDLSEADLGIPVDFPHSKGQALIMTNDEDDFHQLSFFLICQGYEPVIVKPKDAIPEGDYNLAILYVQDKQTANERFKVLMTEYAKAPIVIMVGKNTGYSDKLMPANAIVMEGNLNYVNLFHLIKKVAQGVQQVDEDDA